MTSDSLFPFTFPAVRRKKVTAAFDGGRLTSDGGVLLLAQAEKRLGLTGNRVLDRDPAIVAVADAACVDRAVRNIPVLRRYAQTRYAARSWDRPRRVVARIEASELGLDVRLCVTSLTRRSAGRLYEQTYCQRGAVQNLIKRPKAQLDSDRTSCRSATANQMWLILHSGAYWLMWQLQAAIPAASALKTAEFATLRLRLLKVAARVIETASRVRVAFASACPDAALFRRLATTLAASP